ncbi:MAG: hypothetical protein E7559_00165 [Ruminococcaceae bacterium]|nr:hypothetical protein [Oscillospiraceae bacterium]
MNIKDRAIMFTAVFICIEVILVGHLLGYASVINNINPNSDAAQERLIKHEIRNSTVPGPITDRDGIAITYAEQPGDDIKIVFPEPYSLLLGYNNSRQGDAGMLANSRLGKHILTPDSTSCGATVRLTLDNDVQQAAYKAIQGYDACAVVIEAKTGKVITLVTTDPDIVIDYSTVDSIEQSNSKADSYSGSLIANWDVYLATGSDIKAVTACGIVESGWENEIYRDTGSETIGFTIHNAYRGGKGNISMKQAMIHSCNCYFFYYADQLGLVQMKDLYERFGIGEDIELDFMRLRARHNFETSTRTEVACAGFGQGKLEVSIVNIAMFAAAFANDGAMMKPYMIDCVYNNDGEIMHTEPAVYKQSVSAETAEIINDALAATAKSYGFGEGIYAKTGTADIWDGTNRAVLMTHNGDYAVAVCVDETHMAGKQLVPMVKQIYKALDAADARAEAVPAE